MTTDSAMIQSEYIVARAAVLVVTTDLAGRITICNDDFVLASGYARSELIGWPLDFLEHPDTPPEVLRAQWITHEDGVIRSTLIKSQRKNGTPYWVRSTTATLLSAGRNVGFLVMRTRPPLDQLAAARAQHHWPSDPAHGQASMGVHA